MKIVAMIPARYQSSRFPGKPLADILGKPMVWWVYQQVKKVTEISAVYVVTDDERIAEVCRCLNMAVLMTSPEQPTSTQRLFEAADLIEADYYMCINGDEPLIQPDTIAAILPEQKTPGNFYVANLMTQIRNPAETLDYTNIKVVTDSEGYALFMSRSPIPYPKSETVYHYYKHVGVLLYTFEALRFFAETPKGFNELIEDINELRFIEHGRKIRMVEVNADTLSVDTPKDLRMVRQQLKGCSK